MYLSRKATMRIRKHMHETTGVGRFLDASILVLRNMYGVGRREYALMHAFACRNDAI